jgi:hypothetical protein
VPAEAASLPLGALFTRRQQVFPDADSVWFCQAHRYLCKTLQDLKRHVNKILAKSFQAVIIR